MNSLRVNFYTYVMGLGIVDAILVEKNTKEIIIKNKNRWNENYGDNRGSWKEEGFQLTIN